MPKNCFFLNYGGPGDYWFASNAQRISALDEACRNHYGPPHRTEEFSIHGLQIKVLTYGYHRALQVELPPNADAASKRLYQILREEAHAFCDKEYAILTNNCVTSVAHILHRLDPLLSPKYLVLPWTLDSALKKSPVLHIPPSFMQPFFEVYDKKDQSNYFNFVSQRTKLRSLKSVQDVIVNAYHGEHRERERTKSSLLELQWVTEDKNGILHPTAKAPVDFSIGLQQFNHDYQAVLELKSFAELQEISQDKLEPIFQDNPDYATACERLKANFATTTPMIYQSIIAHMEKWKELNTDVVRILFEDSNDEIDDDSSLNI